MHTLIVFVIGVLTRVFGAYVSEDFNEGIYSSVGKRNHHHHNSYYHMGEGDGNLRPSIQDQLESNEITNTQSEIYFNIHSNRMFSGHKHNVTGDFTIKQNVVNKNMSDTGNLLQDSDKHGFENNDINNFDSNRSNQDSTNKDIRYLTEYSNQNNSSAIEKPHIVTSNDVNYDTLAKPNTELDKPSGEKWIWSTTVDPLANKAAFVGANCPSGMIKVAGKCVSTY